ncbi:MAG: metal ABC transporter ATP-binding protein [Bacillota bacterium]
MEKIIDVKNISFSYDRELILKDIDLEVFEGDFIAFIGPNGSGKSTLLKLILGFLEPEKGEIKLFGQQLDDFDNWTRIGYVSQEVRDFNQSFPATVKEIIAANLYQQMGFFKLLTSDLEEKINQTLELVEMLEYKNKQIGNLSGGEKQKIFIARTLVTNPSIILLDEPLVGVDSDSQQEFYQLLANLNSELEITIIMISHDVHVISDQANKIACFANDELFLHQADNFSCKSYLSGLADNQMWVDRHQHQESGENEC